MNNIIELGTKAPVSEEDKMIIKERYSDIFEGDSVKEVIKLSKVLPDIDFILRVDEYRYHIFDGNFSIERVVQNE